MNTNAEIDTWRRLWQTQSDALAPADLRDRIAREIRRQKVALIAPVLVTLVIGGVVVARAIASPQLDNVVMAVEAWLYIAAIWAGSLWISRGTRRPLADTTLAFIELSIRRCRSILSGLRFGAFMYIAQLLVMLLLRHRYSGLSWDAILGSWPVSCWAGPAVLCCSRSRSGIAAGKRRNFGTCSARETACG